MLNALALHLAVGYGLNEEKKEGKEVSALQFRISHFQFRILHRSHHTQFTLLHKPS